ncbi:HAD family hydrolase [Winogradskyella arenosi]|uniref:Putative hydrolase of the HAD superfamily n=1 Tax=Winogradskyella arenosi TaxID=533325 RepID=A0A368ZGD7_9FLAO|nr:HAD family hydrolase [Winogradskyella arenosi]RCW92586.1 putative hydrolase of the HAD superfamily [Winogradskyella arenosi]
MEVDYKNIQVIGFDADDTLWVNETYFREAEAEVGLLLSHFETPNKIDQELFKIEIKNLPTYGYGVKGFVLSMIELALDLSNGTVSNTIIEKILELGKAMINKPIELLDGVEEVLKGLSKDYKLIVATKGDLLDQERKLEKSGLLKYFHHIEVLSEKKEENYKQLLKRLDIEPESFLMVGNSLKSDILPLVKIGAQAIHVPFHTTWQHERVTQKETHGLAYKTVSSLTEILNYF